MSFIAVTYGYNQYSIFNTNVSTYPLLDTIVTTCLDEIINLLNLKLPLWEEQINNYNNEEELIKKNIKKLETDKQKEEEKAAELSKLKDSGNQNNSDNNTANKNIINKKSTPVNIIKVPASNKTYYILVSISTLILFLYFICIIYR